MMLSAPEVLSRSHKMGWRLQRASGCLRALDYLPHAREQADGKIGRSGRSPRTY